jgi:hypothetical protein
MGVRFPLDRKTRNDLAQHVGKLNELAIDDLVILFNDQRDDYDYAQSFKDCGKMASRCGTAVGPFAIRTNAYRFVR